VVTVDLLILYLLIRKTYFPVMEWVDGCRPLPTGACSLSLQHRVAENKQTNKLYIYMCVCVCVCMYTNVSVGISLCHFLKSPSIYGGKNTLVYFDFHNFNNIFLNSYNAFNCSPPSEGHLSFF
jgi:hypothetical protein